MEMSQLKRLSKNNANCFLLQKAYRTCLFFIHNGRSYYTAPAYTQKRAVSRPMNPRYGGFVRLVSAAHLVPHKGPVIIY